MGIRYRDVPLDEVERRFPMVRPEGLARVVETAGAGMLFPSRILTDLVVLLGRLGVTLHAGSKVTEVDGERGTVVKNGREYGGDVPWWWPPAPGRTGWCRRCGRWWCRPARPCCTCRRRRTWPTPGPTRP